MWDVGHASYHGCQCKWTKGSSATTSYHVNYKVHQRECPPTHFIEGWMVLKTELDWYGGENISLPPAFEPRTVRPVVNHHTDDAVPAADINMR